MAFLNNAFNSKLPLYMLMRQGCVFPPMASEKLVQRLINNVVISMLMMLNC